MHNLGCFLKDYFGFPETAHDSSTRNLREDNKSFFLYLANTTATSKDFCHISEMFFQHYNKPFPLSLHFFTMAFWPLLLCIFLAIVIPSLQLYPTVTLAGSLRGSRRISITTSCVSLVPLFLLLVSPSSLPSFFPSFLAAH